MQFSKPRKLINTANPGGRFMSSSMFNAREVLIPGSAYDRSGAQPQSSLNGGTFFGRDPFMQATHDQMGFIPQDRNAYNATMHLPVPIGMFIPPVPAYQQPAFQPGSMYLILWDTFVPHVCPINVTIYRFEEANWWKEWLSRRAS